MTEKKKQENQQNAHTVSRNTLSASRKGGISLRSFGFQSCFHWIWKTQNYIKTVITRYNSLVKFISFVFPPGDHFIKTILPNRQRNSVIAGWKATTNYVPSSRGDRKDVMRCHLGAPFEGINCIGFAVNEVAMKCIFCVRWAVNCVVEFLIKINRKKKYKEIFKW